MPTRNIPSFAVLLIALRHPYNILKLQALPGFTVNIMSLEIFVKQESKNALIDRPSLSVAQGVWQPRTSAPALNGLTG